MKNTSIRLKLFLTTMSILVLTVMITSYVNVINFRFMYREALLERARADAHDIRKGIEQSLNYFHLDNFSDMTAFLNRHLNENFSYAYVADNDLKILYHTDPGEVGVDLKDETYSGLDLESGAKSNIVATGTFYEMVIPVIKDFEVIGTIHIGIENDIVDSKVRTMIIQNGAILLLAIFLSIFALYALLERNITAPITRLAGKVKDISEKFDLGMRVNNREKGDEIKKFELMFDTMAEEIRMKTASLEQDIKRREEAEMKLKKSYKELSVTFEGSIRSLATAIESRDPYTAGHQQRVAELACAIAGEMKLSESKIREIYFSAMSHDIGKIGVPSVILTKKSQLTGEEYEIIKTHPQIGHDILKEIEFPWPISTIVRQHHERLDGSGYPLGIKGDDILLESRIVAVADVVEAITSERPYRAAMGKDVAMKEIFDFRGIKYDASVVDICLDLFRNKNFEFKNERKISASE
ncbi:MAG: HD domain-containing phosphohydrolase [Candidatus Omnitrophota bacterium]